MCTQPNTFCQLVYRGFVGALLIGLFLGIRDLDLIGNLLCGDLEKSTYLMRM